MAKIFDKLKESIKKSVEDAKKSDTGVSTEQMKDLENLKAEVRKEEEEENS